MRFEEEINAGAGISQKPARTYTAVLFLAPNNKVLLAKKDEDVWCLQTRMCSPLSDAAAQANIISDTLHLDITGVQLTSLVQEGVDPYDKKIEHYRVILVLVKFPLSAFLRQSGWHSFERLPDGLSEMARLAISLAVQEGILSKSNSLAAA